MSSIDEGSRIAGLWLAFENVIIATGIEVIELFFGLVS